MSNSQYDEVVLGDSIKSIEEVFSCEEFIHQIRNLSDTSILYTCNLSDLQLTGIYSAAIEQFDMRAMTLPYFRQFLTSLRENNRQKIKNEVEYYREQIRQRLKNNLERLSKKQFWKIIGNRTNKEANSILSQIFIEQSQNTEFVSCRKIMAMLDDVVRQIEEIDSPTLSFDNLLTKRISEVHEVDTHGNMDEILDVFGDEQNTQLQRYFSLWHKLISYVYEFVGDDEVRYHIQNFLQDIPVHESALLEEKKAVFLMAEEQRSTCIQYEEVIKRLNQQIELYEQTLDELKSQKSQIVRQLRTVQKQHQLMADQNDHLNGFMSEEAARITQLSKQYNEVSEQLDDYKKRYNELYIEYQKLAEQRNTQAKITKKEEQAKIFAERSLKLQLDDTLHRFNKLLKERNSERKAFEAKDENRVNQIEMLEAKVLELENQIKSKNQQLNLYISKSSISDFRKTIFMNSRISIMKGIRESVGSSIYGSKSSKIIKPSLKRQESQPKAKSGILPEELQLHKSARLTANLEELESKPVTVSKLKAINIAADPLSLIQEEDDIVIDTTLLPPEQNLTNIINNDSTQNSPVKKTIINEKESEEKLQHNKASLSQSRANQDIRNDYFMSKGILINIYGVKNETTFLMTQKRFCFFDTKLRLSKYLPIQNIKCFVFCRTNPTLFIVRPKNVAELSSREHITNPVIISTRNRGAFASFLGHRISKTITERQVELLTRFQDDIFLKIDGNEINMKHKIPNMKNPFRLAISHAPVFYAKIQEEGMFNRKQDAVLIVQPIGILCFQGNEVYQLEAERHFLYLLPLDEGKIYEKEDSKEAPGRKVRIIYQTELLESYYSLIFNSKEDVKQFLKAVEEQRRTNDNNKTSTYKALNELFKK